MRRQASRSYYLAIPTRKLWRKKMTLNVVLIEPEIPQNTGNIARTCAATGAVLHLIEPLGFSLSDRYLKRAGLDYWNDVNIKCYKNFEHFKVLNEDGAFYYATAKATNNYSEIIYPEDVYLIFGKETAGIPEYMLKENKESSIRVPMLKTIRSLNLANSVAIIVYEVLRQRGFNGFVQEGVLGE
jgi:tRNA (cytidine/uridine-2'-O-)-methyltransferase